MMDCVYVVCGSLGTELVQASCAASVQQQMEQADVTEHAEVGMGGRYSKSGEHTWRACMCASRKPSTAANALSTAGRSCSAAPLLAESCSCAVSC